MLRGKIEGISLPSDRQTLVPANGPKRIGEGTPQQEALWAALCVGETHVLGEARAGCGKSSSCREGMHRMLAVRPGQSIRYAVFNRAAADEFRTECPPGVQVGTTHSFGCVALQRSFRSKIESNKSYLLLDETSAGRQLPRYMRRSIATLVSAAKNAAVVPSAGEEGNRLELERLLVYYDVNSWGKTHVIVDWALEILGKSLAWPELIDFDDMLWLPPLLSAQFEDCDTLFLDECQDLNPAQRKCIPLMCRRGRVVIVGDRYQAINAFRGADLDSLPSEAARLAQTERGLAAFPLTVTFRCPKSHVALANEYVPDLQAAPSAPEGEITQVAPFGALLSYTAPGDLVVSYTNAPIISHCLRCLKAGVPAYVRGRAIGQQLTDVIRGLRDARTVANLTRGVEKWRNTQLLKLTDRDAVEDLQQSITDRADRLLAILDSCQELSEVEPLIARLFGDEKRADRVTCSTVHRAKGDEAERVFLIQTPFREPKRPWQARQNANLQYVGLTRSKHLLAFVEPPKKD